MDIGNLANRIVWDELPATVREAVAERLGSPVVASVVQPGGFSHGLACKLELGDGRSVFAKAIQAHDVLAAMYRTEARTTARLPAAVPTPRLQHAIESDGWLVTVFDFVVGRHPHLDRPDELTAVLDTVGTLARLLTPTPIPGLPVIADEYGTALTGWRAFAEHRPPDDLDDWPHESGSVGGTGVDLAGRSCRRCVAPQ